jgi:hypothetical protein
VNSTTERGIAALDWKRPQQACADPRAAAPARPARAVKSVPAVHAAPAAEPIQEAPQAAPVEQQAEPVKPKKRHWWQ